MARRLHKTAAENRTQRALLKATKCITAGNTIFIITPAAITLKRDGEGADPTPTEIYAYAGDPLAIGNIISLRIIAEAERKHEHNSYFIERSRISKTIYFIRDDNGLRPAGKDAAEQWQASLALGIHPSPANVYVKVIIAEA